METGDGLTVLGVCGAIIAAILKFVPSKNKGSNDGVKEVKANLGTLKKDVVFKDTCEAVHKGVDDKLDLIKGNLEKGIDEIKDMIRRRDE